MATIVSTNFDDTLSFGGFGETHVFVLRGVTLTGRPGIDFAPGIGFLTVDGTIASHASFDGTGIRAFGNPHITVLSGASVSGSQYGITTGPLDNGSVTNHGTVSGGTGGLSVQYNTASDRVPMGVINTGLISGAHGIEAVQGSGLGTYYSRALNIINSGTILGTTWAIALNDALSGSDRVENSGLIHGGVTLGAGNDVLVNAGRIVGNVWTGSGNDLVDLRGGTVTGQVNTGSGNDTVIVDDETVILSEFLGGGVDTVISYAPRFALAAGFDRLELAGTAIEGNGNAGANTLQGNVFDNLLRGGAGADTIFGGAGRDDLRGGWAADSLSGGADEDTLWGGDGNDTLSGNEDDDLLYGQAGNDALAGDAGDDRIFAGAGNDTVTGGAGLDTMTGGLGSDVFVFAATSESPVEAPDTITDFRSGRDVINLEAAFGGVLLFIGTAAFTGSGQVRYSAVDGGIMVEVDTVSRGSGHEMEIFLAGISQVLASDFVL